MAAIIVRLSEAVQAQLTGGRAMTIAMCEACKVAASIDQLTISGAEDLHWVCAKGAPGACPAAEEKGR